MERALLWLKDLPQKSQENGFKPETDCLHFDLGEDTNEILENLVVCRESLNI